MFVLCINHCMTSINPLVFGGNNWPIMFHLSVSSKASMTTLSSSIRKTLKWNIIALMLITSFSPLLKNISYHLSYLNLLGNMLDHLVGFWTLLSLDMLVVNAYLRKSMHKKLLNLLVCPYVCLVLP